MFNELINKVTEPVSMVLMGVKEGFAKCNSEEEMKNVAVYLRTKFLRFLVLLKKVGRLIFSPPYVII